MEICARWTASFGNGRSVASLVFVFAFLTQLTTSAGKVMLGPCKATRPLDSEESPRSATGPVQDCNMDHVDIVLGGLFPVHRFTDGACPDDGKLTFGIQLVEAMRHAVDQINSNRSILGNVTLGYEIRDTCYHSPYAIQEALKFLNVDTDEQCSTATVNNSNGIGETGNLRRVKAVIGPAASRISLTTTQVLDLFEIPMISFASTSPQLSDAELYPFFYRTIPSDSLVGEAIGKMIRDLDWTFIGFVYSDDSYGRDSVAVILRAIGVSTDCGVGNQKQRANITERCVSFQWPISDVAGPDDKVFASIWDDILFNEPQNRTSVVVVIVHSTEVQFFFQYPLKTNDTKIKEAALNKNTTFIGSDSWGDAAYVIRTNEEIAKGAVSPLPAAPPYMPFREHWTNLNPIKNSDNPWIEELFGCNSSNPKRPCHWNTSLDEEFSMVVFVPYVYHAVFAVAHALDILYQNCNRDVQCLRVTPQSKLREALSDVDFTTIYGERFQFARNGDPAVTQHDIKNVRVAQNDAISFPIVGRFSAEIGRHSIQTNDIGSKDSSHSGRSMQSHHSRISFQLDHNLVVWNDGSGAVPRSRCSPDCEVGHIRVGNGVADPCLSGCCWSCAACTENTFVGKNNSYTCQSCASTQTTGPMSTGCLPLPVKQYSLPHPLATIGTILACFGFILWSLCCIQCIQKRHCFFQLGLEPTAAILLGIFLTYSSMLVELAGPSNVTCASRSFTSAMGMVIVSSSLFIYVCHRLSLVFRTRLSEFLLSSDHQCAVSGILVAGQLGLLLFFLLTGDFSVAQVNIVSHVSVVRLCGVHSVDLYSLVYLIVLDTLLSTMAGVCLYFEQRRPGLTYVPDPGSAILLMICGASFLSTFIMTLALATQSSVNEVIRDLLLHVNAWQHATSFMLLVILQPLRKLAPLSEEEQKWRSDTTQAVRFPRSESSNRSSAEPKSQALRSFVSSCGSQGGTGLRTGQDVAYIGGLPENSTSCADVTMEDAHGDGVTKTLELVEINNARLSLSTDCTLEDGGGRQHMCMNCLGSNSERERDEFEGVISLCGLGEDGISEDNDDESVA